MIITDTQLAAALMVLGHEPAPTDFDVVAVVFQFQDGTGVLKHQLWWSDMSRCGRATGDAPLEIMFKVSKAREWMLKQVIHGHHNEGLNLPVEVLTTYDLHVAVSLVAKGCYLLKLDKRTRLFYFSQAADSEYADYQLPSEWFRHARVYLDTLDKLVRRIHNRNFARQGKQAAIPCTTVSATKSETRNFEHA